MAFNALQAANTVGMLANTVRPFLDNNNGGGQRRPNNNMDDEDFFMLDQESVDVKLEREIDELVATYATNKLRRFPDEDAETPLFKRIQNLRSSFRYVLREYELFFPDGEMYKYYNFLLPEDSRRSDAARENLRRMAELGRTTFSQRSTTREDLYLFLYFALRSAGGTEIARELANPNSELARLYNLRNGAPQFVQERARNPQLSAYEMGQIKDRELGLIQ